ncbi:MAG TPA: Crp/Fnr family transcriptional regulator [Bacteroidales bacterium]|nr:Crp/Fnr family transcriptional regulator [Bacteroidales bacterium]
MIRTNLQNLFKKLSPLTDEEIEEAMPLFKRMSLKRNKFFIREYQLSSRIAFVGSGILRSFYSIQDKETTTFFLVPGSIAVALRSFVKKLPAFENIQAVVDSELLYITRDDLYSLYKESWKWQQVGRRIIEESYIEMEMRSITLQSQSASERYKNFSEEYKNILKSVPLHYVASYLGVSPETLSRIRKKG